MNRLLKRRGWRAPTGTGALTDELRRATKEAERAFGEPVANLTPTQLRALATDIVIRADSLADLLHILARCRDSK